MGNKFSNKYIWVLMLVLGVFVMAVTALIGGNSSIRNAQQTAQRTLQYLQNQCISYRDIVAADRLKSLVRLTEQAQEVAEREGMVGQNRSNEELARYAQRQRVTCVLVLDKDLEIEFSSGADMDWSDYYTNEAIRSIMDYPEKIFARRLTRDGAVYDIAAVARVEIPASSSTSASSRTRSSPPTVRPSRACWRATRRCSMTGSTPTSPTASAWWAAARRSSGTCRWTRCPSSVRWSPPPPRAAS